jgi:hypothetical protein
MSGFDHPRLYTLGTWAGKPLVVGPQKGPPKNLVTPIVRDQENAE